MSGSIICRADAEILGKAWNMGAPITKDTLPRGKLVKLQRIRALTSTTSSGGVRYIITRRLFDSMVRMGIIDMEKHYVEYC